MHQENGNLRRAHLGANIDENGVSSLLTNGTSDASKGRKKGCKSSLSLSCQRWMVRFLSMRKPSQVILTILGVCVLILLPPTVYFMSTLPLAVVRRKAWKAWKNPYIAPVDRHIGEEFDDKGNGMVRDKYGINGNATFTRFSHRKSLPSLIPRVVMLSDTNHTFKFKSPPGNVMFFPPLATREEPFVLKQSVMNFKNPPQQRPPDDMVDPSCEFIEPTWQLAYHPTCNQIHEASGGWQKLYRVPDEKLPEKSDKDDFAPDDEHREQTRYLAAGAYRDVWMIRDGNDGITKRVMKTLRANPKSKRFFDLRNFDRHRRDAIAFEQTVASPYIVDMWGYCSNTALFNYADGGDLVTFFERHKGDDSDDEDEKPEISTKEDPLQTDEFKLHVMEIAYNASMSIHDFHNFNDYGQATMAHTDVKTNQFIYEDGYYKLSDFNRARFLMWDPTGEKQCGFRVGRNAGEYRAPEEYEYRPENEKVDVFSLGNILFYLLAQRDAWQGVKHEEVYRLVKAGKRAKFPKHIYESDGVFEKYMIKAIESAWIHSVSQRPGALHVANIIKEGLELKREEMNLVA